MEVSTTAAFDPTLKYSIITVTTHYRIFFGEIGVQTISIHKYTQQNSKHYMFYTFFEAIFRTSKTHDSKRALRMPSGPQNVKMASRIFSFGHVLLAVHGWIPLPKKKLRNLEFTVYMSSTLPETFIFAPENEGLVDDYFSLYGPPSFQLLFAFQGGYSCKIFILHQPTKYDLEIVSWDATVRSKSYTFQTSDLEMNWCTRRSFERAIWIHLTPPPFLFFKVSNSWIMNIVA